ncbi:MAG TPA: polymorphic toxin-type HINT domain-containing protein [Accumulibacter sp.]|nr:polymorphic toxin-type HINT domain-containing protein [Accumulibacter sp.]
MRVEISNEMKLSGQALQKEMLKRLEELTGEPPCFVAGTPVWTDRGLVPIEKLKIGDLVLSKSEITGEKAYKRVVRTFRTEDQEIRTINIEGALNEDGSDRLIEYFFTTPNHPFWVNRNLKATPTKDRIDSWAERTAVGVRSCI